MGRGRDKTISLSDIRNMTGREIASLGNRARLGDLKFKGTAVVRDGRGNARYEDQTQAGNYGEQNV